MRRTHRLALLVLLLAAVARGQADAKPEVALKAAPGWDATLVYQGNAGIWTCGDCKVFAQYGCPDLFALDDKGRCTLLSSYSGKWTPHQTVHDYEWLGALAVADVDPRVPGEEIYVGGKRGNLYKIKTHREGGVDTAIIARFPGEEIHTIVAADLDPARPGTELVVFTLLGAAYLLTPREGYEPAFEVKLIETLPGRVRQALVIPDPKDGLRTVAVMRSGQVMLLKLSGGEFAKTEIAAEAMGLGRIDRRPPRSGKAEVLYYTRDDGVILRLEEKPDGGFMREVIYNGPQGPRGIAAGRFDADPDVETVAVFGYSSKVEMLSRKGGGAWIATAIFTDVDKGHWLDAVEVDGRNATDELIGSGYGARVFMLSRPPGYGVPAVPASRSEEKARAEGRPNALKVAVRGAGAFAERPSPLVYKGGFEAKTMLYETLVRRDDRGRLCPGLAARWEVDAARTTWRLHLEPGRTFHDGSPVDAARVAAAFRRWLGLPESAWLGISEVVTSVTAEAPTILKIETVRPYAVPDDLCAVNPTAVLAPSSFDHEGLYVKPIGSGPYRFVRFDSARGVLELEATTATRGPVAVDLIARLGGDLSAEVAAGALDIVSDGWGRLIDRAKLEPLPAGVEVIEAPGSSVRWLVPNAARTALRAASKRAGLALAIDRPAVASAACGRFASPCERLFAEAVADWPAATRPTESEKPAERLRFIVGAGAPEDLRAARAVAASCAEHGIAVDVVEMDGAALAAALTAGEWDLRLDESWGLPYDPFITLRGLLRPRSGGLGAVGEESVIKDSVLGAEIDAMAAETDEGARRSHYASIQKRVDEETLLIPLYVPERIVIARKGVARPKLGPDLYRLEFASPGN